MSVGAGLSPARRRKRTRLILVLGGLALLAAATGMTLTALQDNIAFFHGPTGIAEGEVGPGVNFRLGGLVKDGSVGKLADGTTNVFVVTDQAADVTVHFEGLLPDLFREGQGIVAMGRLRDDRTFIADEVLAKHDETYMPAEAVEAMKRAGTWRHAEDGEDGTGENGEGAQQ